ncbi:hypothetical protein RFI_03451 [Reticulomyxa filosa]|uniref:Uncharacterized protein n=1 Tax=Reticulomyxa filosa TaxID=46433 RepID=X6P630_RETFI|nr:hypothetical protein RFI_03451 [Reticulomyxa filosa]|eukprot:ETO33651.1 hypothetical protein RFI_03451 [Reticulomyxa filosa]
MLFPYFDGAESLIQYDTTTGNATTLIPSSGQQLTGEGLICLDDINNILYFLYEEETINREGLQLVTGLQPFNLENLQVLNPVILSMVCYVATFFSVLQIQERYLIRQSNNKNVRYVWGHSKNDTTVQLLVRVVRDPVSNNVSLTIVNQYKETDEVGLLAGSPQAYDSKRNMIWLAAVRGTESDFTFFYYYINALNGQIVSTVLADQWSLITAVYDPTLDSLVGMVLDSENDKGQYNYALAYADPVTLDITKTLQPITDYCEVYAVNSADVINGVGYYIMFKMPSGIFLDILF